MKIDDSVSKCAVMNGKIFCISKIGNYYLGRIPEDGATAVEVDNKVDCIAQSKTQQQYAEEKEENDANTGN